MTTASDNANSDSAGSESELDDASLAAIRALMADQPVAAPVPQTIATAPPPTPEELPPRRTKADALPALEAPQAEDSAPLKPHWARPGPRLFARIGVPRRRKALASAAAGTEAVGLPPARETPGPIAGLILRIKAYRPTPRHVVFGALAILIVSRPWLIAGVLLVTLVALAGALLVLGVDGFWRRLIRVVEWYGGRQPARAAALLRSLDRFASKWDAILDRFPQGSVDGLYLPDTGAIAAADKRHDEALARRLDGIRRENI